MSSLESSVSFWDGLSFWLTMAGASLIFFGTISSIAFRRHNRQLLKLQAVEIQRERDATAKSLAESTERAAKAEQAAAEANLALEKFKAPRTLAPEQSQRITEAAKPFAGTPFTMSVFNDPEPIALMSQIEDALISAGWTETEWKGSGDVAFTRTGRPNVGLMSMQGVFVQADIDHLAEFKSAVSTLAFALRAAGLPVQAEIGRIPPNTNNNVIQIQVGKKP